MPEPAGGDDVVCLHQPFCDLLHDGLVERGDLCASLLVEGYDYALIARVQVIVLDDWVLVVVDAFLPCIDNEPLYASTKSGSMWCSFLEKALAKIFGGY